MLEARMDLMHAAKWYHWPPFSWNRYTVYRLHASILHRCLYRRRGGLCVLHPGKMEGCFTFSTKACHFAFPFYRFSSKLWLPLRFVSRCRYFTTSLPFSFGKIVRIYRCSKLLTIRHYILTSITPLELYIFMWSEKEKPASNDYNDQFVVLEWILKIIGEILVKSRQIFIQFFFIIYDLF